MARSAASARVAAFYILAALLGTAVTAPAAAMVGGARPGPDGAGRSVVMILGSYGTACTATAIARDLLLTAAHCVEPGADYKLAEKTKAGMPSLKAISRIERDPQFDLRRLLHHLATADVAVAKLAQPLPENISPVPLDDATRPVVAGEVLVVAGYGVTIRGDGRTGGTARAASLVVTGEPNMLQIPPGRSAHQRPQGRAWRLRRQFRRAGLSRKRRQACHRRRGELVDRTETDRRLRRADRHHAAYALSCVDRSDGAGAWLAAEALNKSAPARPG